MNKPAQFTPGPCPCEIVMRTGETLDSSLGDKLCSDISRIQLCPKHAAAPAMYEALQEIDDQLDQFTVKAQEDLGLRGALLRIRDALAQAEGKQ